VVVLLPVMAWTGLLVALPVLYHRAGLNRAKHPGVDWREFLAPNLPWFFLLGAKSLFWPVTVVVWVLQGRPGTAWTAITSYEGRPVRQIVRAR
jgi:hypothetical protein